MEPLFPGPVVGRDGKVNLLCGELMLVCFFRTEWWHNRNRFYSAEWKRFLVKREAHT